MKIPRGTKPPTPRALTGGFATVDIGGIRGVIPGSANSAGVDDGTGGSYLSTCKRILGAVRPRSRWLLTIPSAVGSCANIDTGQTSILTGTALPLTGEVITIDGVDYTPTLTVDYTACCPYIFTLVGVGSGASTILTIKGECGVDSSGRPYIEFYTADPRICTDDAVGGCGENSVLFRLTCGSGPVIVTPCGEDYTIAGVLYYNGTLGYGPGPTDWPQVNLPVYFYGVSAGVTWVWYSEPIEVPGNPECTMMLQISMVDGGGGVLDVTIAPISGDVEPNPPFCEGGVDTSIQFGEWTCGTRVYTGDGNVTESPL